ncbi:uncharacterized protein [Watersipora subatra]|uniref:uncharacterized protein n=1 Tax=Watersipora subatra TaxID=2589382 RepID=UPI00355C64F6
MGKHCSNSSAYACNNVQVAPFTEVTIVANVDSNYEGKECLFEGNTDTLKRLMIGRSTTRVDQGKIIIPIINPTSRPFKLKKDTVVGSTESLDEDLRLLSVPTTPAEPEKLRPFPSDQLDISKMNLTEEQFSELRELVDEFSDIAGEGITKLGQTSIVQPIVETLPGTMPIRSKPYNIPVGVRAEIKQQIDQMQEKYLISPSSGKWTSPVVLVRKKRWQLEILRRLPQTQCCHSEAVHGHFFVILVRRELNNI